MAAKRLILSCVVLMVLPGAGTTLRGQTAGFAYVANAGSNTISVIDTATNRVVATVPVGLSPIGVATTPNGDFTYVANAGSNTVSVIDTATNRVVATVPVGLNPIGVAITPNGDFAYVGNAHSDTVSVIDTATNIVIAVVPVGSTPEIVAITPDGASAYVTNNLSDSVSVITTATNAVVATVSVGFRPVGVAITPDGAFAYVANLDSNNISVINTTSNAVVATVPVGLRPWGLAITPDGAFAYISNHVLGASSVWVVETATNTVVGTIPVGNTSSGVAITRDGAFAYVANFGSNDASLIETSTNTVVATVPVGSAPFGVAITAGRSPIPGFLSFPLRYKTAFSAKINTVFDHSMTQQYCPDGVVTAYTGEEGRLEFDKSTFTVSFQSCPNQPRELYGFKQDVVGTPFGIGGQYDAQAQTDSGVCCFLFYDGHPGYDYRTIDQTADGTPCPDTDPFCNLQGTTPVLAAATGTVRCVNPLDHATAECPEGPGEVKIEHPNGYFTIYLHLSTISIAKDQQVSTGQPIAISGNTGPAGTPPHLHFEVRKMIGGVPIPVDPYGWHPELHPTNPDPSKPDPYAPRATNVDLWQ